MSYAPPLPVDDFTNRERNQYTHNIKDTIAFCQLLGLIDVIPCSPCNQDHHNCFFLEIAAITTINASQFNITQSSINPDEQNQAAAITTTNASQFNITESSINPD
ncbi:unnamed protein product [Rotaria sordida]|uniref:Uncharacterized protein n=1 Tax=Rotaria sordida TaxID=392033 RepID=A0A816D400_9BILA|nr:unnamed protein product [Rotaria sordida]CAF1461032.1 unnamed protein product [Rotaria sordida]CAF1629770.1 unnamed protein product [Rotaria sordida]